MVVEAIRNATVFLPLWGLDRAILSHQTKNTRRPSPGVFVLGKSWCLVQDGERPALGSLLSGLGTVLESRLEPVQDWLKPELQHGSSWECAVRANLRHCRDFFLRSKLGLDRSLTKTPHPGGRKRNRPGRVFLLVWASALLTATFQRV